METKKKRRGRSVRAFSHISIVPETTKEGSALKVMRKFCNLILWSSCLISPFDGNVSPGNPCLDLLLEEGYHSC